jgi:hypothetical protein
MQNRRLESAAKLVRGALQRHKMNALECVNPTATAYLKAPSGVSIEITLRCV